jgi:DNA-binding NtrC family response regulator
VVIDCGALPAALLESELFGHERGAFTGATQARVGAFEAAAGGTVFLDEVGELDPGLQPRLLRALEKREVKRVGGSSWSKIDVRVIAATHRNLQADVNSGRFRSDLYYRLAVLRVELPPLREREGDLPLLVEELLEQLGAGVRPEAMRLRDDAFLAGLACHTWPGNVRELRNYAERALALREPPTLEPGDEIPSLKLGRDEAIAAFERRYLETLLTHHRGNVSAAARTAGVERGHLYRLLWRHGLR